MSEESTERQDRIAFLKKWHAIMSAIDRVPKDGWNPHYNYPYVSEAAVMEMFRDLFSDHGLIWFVDLIEQEQEKVEGTKNFRVRVFVQFEFCDIDTGYSRKVDWVGEAIDQQDKGTSKAFTAACKYALLKLFQVSSGTDEDADRGPNPQGSRPQRSTQSGAKATEKQTNYIKQLVPKAGLGDDTNAALAKAKFPPLEQLTRSDAASVIERLLAKIKENAETE